MPMSKRQRRAQKSRRRLTGPVRPLQAKFVGRESHALADMTGVYEDLTWCASTCRLLNDRAFWKKLPGVAAIEALHDTIYIRYGRCFRGGVRTAFVIPQDWIHDLPTELR